MQHEVDRPSISWGPAPRGAVPRLLERNYKDVGRRWWIKGNGAGMNCMEDAGSAGPGGRESVGAEGMVFGRVTRRREKSESWRGARWGRPPKVILRSMDLILWTMGATDGWTLGRLLLHPSWGKSKQDGSLIRVWPPKGRALLQRWCPCGPGWLLAAFSCEQEMRCTHSQYFKIRATAITPRMTTLPLQVICCVTLHMTAYRRTAGDGSWGQEPEPGLWCLPCFKKAALPGRGNSMSTGSEAGRPKTHRV